MAWKAFVFGQRQDTKDCHLRRLLLPSSWWIRRAAVCTGASGLRGGATALQAGTGGVIPEGEGKMLCHPASLGIVFIQALKVLGTRKPLTSSKLRQFVTLEQGALFTHLSAFCYRPCTLQGSGNRMVTDKAVVILSPLPELLP